MRREPPPVARPADRDPAEVPPVAAYRTGEPVWVWTAGRWTTGLVLSVGPAAGLVLAALLPRGRRADRADLPAALVAPRLLPGPPGGAR